MINYEIKRGFGKAVRKTFLTDGDKIEVTGNGQIHWITMVNETEFTTLVDTNAVEDTENPNYDQDFVCGETVATIALTVDDASGIEADDTFTFETVDYTVVSVDGDKLVVSVADDVTDTLAENTFEGGDSLTIDVGGETPTVLDSGVDDGSFSAGTPSVDFVGSTVNVTFTTVHGVTEAGGNRYY